MTGQNSDHWLAGFNELVFNMDDTDYAQGLARNHNGTFWIMRRYHRLHAFQKAVFYADFFRLCAPDSIIPRKTYNAANSILLIGHSEVRPSERLIFDTPEHRIPFLVEAGVPEALAVLFFLNQSCEKLVSVWHNLIDEFKVIDFDIKQNFPDISDTELQQYILTQDAFDSKVCAFMEKLQQSPIFMTRWISMLWIISMIPSIDNLFDFSHNPALKVKILDRQKQLSTYLKEDESVIKILSHLSPDFFQTRINLFLVYLKRFKADRFDFLKREFFNNLHLFFSELLDQFFLKRQIMGFRENEYSDVHVQNLKFQSGLTRFLLTHKKFSAAVIGDNWQNNLALLSTLNTYFSSRLDWPQLNLYYLINRSFKIANQHQVLFSGSAAVVGLVTQNTELNEPVISVDALFREINSGSFVQACMALLVEERVDLNQKVLSHQLNLCCLFHESKNEFLNSKSLPMTTDIFAMLEVELGRADSKQALSKMMFKILMQMSDDFVRIFLRKIISYCVCTLYLPNLISQLLSLHGSRVDFDKKVIETVLNFSPSDRYVAFFFKMLHKIVVDNQLSQGWDADAVLKLSAGYQTMQFSASHAKSLVMTESVAPSLSSSLSTLFSNGVSVSQQTIHDLAPSAKDAAAATVQSAQSVMDYLGRWFNNP